MLIVYTGRGKGKTSAAISTAIRSLIANKKVGYIQFMKTDGNDAAKLKKHFKELEFYSFGTKAFVDPKNISQDAKNKINAGWKKAKELFETKDLIILDEICVALAFGLLDKTEIIETLNRFAMKDTKIAKPYSWPIIVCTGIDCPQELIEISDLVTEMKEIKHPFTKGYIATKGIDF